MTFNDEYSGMGGEYLLDAKGVRKLISRTSPPDEVTASAVQEVAQEIQATDAPTAPQE